MGICPIVEWSVIQTTIWITDKIVLYSDHHLNTELPTVRYSDHHLNTELPTVRYSDHHLNNGLPTMHFFAHTSVFFTESLLDLVNMI